MLQRALDTAARVVGAVGTAENRRRRHIIDRELFAWWAGEQQWRTRKGKKRGAREPAEPGALTLPIDAPARVMYGRFPTTDGRADYHTARRYVSDRHYPDLTAAAAA